MNSRLLPIILLTVASLIFGACVAGAFAIVTGSPDAPRPTVTAPAERHGGPPVRAPLSTGATRR